MKFKERFNVKPTVSVIESHSPYVLINKLALGKMWNYVDECYDEIGWLGTAYRSGRHFIIQDVFLFHQEVHATTTEITVDGLTQFAEELLTNPDMDGMEVWNNMKVWGHSHVRMGVDPSSQDNSQMGVFANSGHDWFIRIIANKLGELKIDLYDYSAGMMYLNVPWEVAQSIEEQEIQTQIEALEKQLDALRVISSAETLPEVKAEMLSKVKKKYTQTAYQGTGAWWNRGQTAATHTAGTLVPLNKSHGGTNITVTNINDDYEDSGPLFATYMPDSVINNVAQIFNYFDEEDLKDFIHTETQFEAYKLAVEKGWAHTFSYADISMIRSYAFNYCEELFNKENKL
jgi:hypothetical protein